MFSFCQMEIRNFLFHFTHHLFFNIIVPSGLISKHNPLSLDKALCEWTFAWSATNSLE